MEVARTAVLEPQQLVVRKVAVAAVSWAVVLIGLSKIAVAAVSWPFLPGPFKRGLDLNNL